MGRESWSNRNIVEDCEVISISWLKKYDYFCGFRSGLIEWRYRSGSKASVGIEVHANGQFITDNYLRINYSMTIDKATDEKEYYDYKVPLVTTPCNYGGFRYWFICPLSVKDKFCGRRVSKLYLPPGSKYFGCRHCHNLTYRCQKEHDKRIDFLIKNPDMIPLLLNRGSIKESLLALRASSKLLEKQ